MPDLHDGYPRHPELSGCENPAVPDHHLAAIIHHDRHNKSEFADAVRDLVDLSLGMLPGVAGIENEVSHRSILNLDLDQTGVGRRVTAGAWCGFRCSAPRRRAFGGLLIGGGHLECSDGNYRSTSTTPEISAEVYNQFAIILPRLPTRHIVRPRGLAQLGFLIGRPSICRPRFIQASRTRGSDLASLFASLYRACSVPGFVMVWLANAGPEACGVRLDPVQSIPNRGLRFFPSAFSPSKAARFPPTTEMIPPRLA